MNEMQRQAGSLFDYGEQVVVAVSGGADSVALLHCLLHCGKNLQLVGAHFNHCLRGSESDGDEAFVRALCSRWGVRFACGRADVAALAERDRLSVEACGRRERYAFLRSVGGRIATAHTLSDRAETLLLNLARGTGLAGLCAIPKQRDGILRPLLMCTRADIERYCAACRLDYRTDSSNHSDAYARNRIRHHVVPVLQSVNTAFERHAGRLMETLSEDEQFLQAQALEQLRRLCRGRGLDARGVAALPPALGRRVLALFLRRADIDPTAELLDRLLCLCVRGERQSLPGKQTAAVRQGLLTIDQPPGIPMQPVALGNYREVSYGCWRIIRCSREEYDFFLNNTPDNFISAVDYAKIMGNVWLRGRQTGDRLCLPNRPAKTLKKLMQEAGLPPRARMQTLVAADGNGPFWVSGFGADTRVLPDVSTRQLLIFQKMEEAPCPTDA